MSSHRAESSTVRVTQPVTDRPCQCSRAGASEIRSRCGFSPKSPQSAAGMRIEPPPSEADAPAQSPAAVAEADPPLDPPGVREVSHGLRVMPHASVSVKPQMASSGRFVLPRTIAPAARSRRTISPSAVAGSSKPLVPQAVTSPSRSSVSFTAMGTPASGIRLPSPAASLASTSVASARALSARTTR